MHSTGHAQYKACNVPRIAIVPSSVLVCSSCLWAVAVLSRVRATEQSKQAYRLLQLHVTEQCLSVPVLSFVYFCFSTSCVMVQEVCGQGTAAALAVAELQVSKHC